MISKTVGFIGAGRVSRIILGGLKRAARVPAKVVVSDASADALKQLQTLFPEVKTILNGNREAAAQEVVFLGLHPPALPGSLAEIKNSLAPGAVVISLAPKVSIARIAEGLEGFDRIVRLLPNAASIIREGYNPMVFSAAFTLQDKEEIRDFLGLLGKCPEVAEDKLEAYAIVTAMGPTYLWFQLYELRNLGEAFGMSAAEAEIGVAEMAIGSTRTLFTSGLSPEQVMDLIPIKPLGDDESGIKAIYRDRLEPLYKKLRS
jgi:pyrroline-5-carboxylate reductase